MNYNFLFLFGLIISFIWFDCYYCELFEVIDDDYIDLIKSIYAFGLNWFNFILGGFNISGYKIYSYDGDNDLSNFNINWNKVFKYVMVFVNW